MATKNPVGKPPKYKNAQTIESTGNDYFDECVRLQKMPTKAGLTLYMDISRDTYSEYRKKYPDAIRSLDSYIEDLWLQKLTGTGATGPIFYLKNAFREHYSDRTETDITSKGEKITTSEEVAALSAKFDEFFKDQTA